MPQFHGEQDMTMMRSMGTNSPKMANLVPYQASKRGKEDLLTYLTEVRAFLEVGL